MISKISLGTAQFGLDYGIANQKGKISFSNAEKIIEFALSKNIKRIDTASAYGDSEKVLGRIGVKNFKITSKIPTIPLNTNNVNEYLIKVNKSADYTVFVSSWLMNLFNDQGLTQKNKKVILAGANKQIFNNDNFSPWNKKEKLKIVTHHWGANWNKGFDTYSQIDEMIGDEKWKNKIEFTYIGNLPKNFSFQHSKHVDPLSGKELAKEIKKNHLYITGSLNEPSGNHHIEGAQCGLPILYIDSGGIPEYCNNFGLKFDSKNFESKLEEIYENYDFYYENMKNYPFNSEKMCDNYFQLFKELCSREIEIAKNRSIDNLQVSNFYLYKLNKLVKKISSKVKL